ncbi:MAG: FAD-dependent oxidoreductase [Halieaceae bacterium]|nr:FAD-dependent oxidoreductase [Halieaceae bacterium]
MAKKRIGIVGAGVNGTSIAAACAARGHEVMLFDSGLAFAETSRKSSRMLHGGIRYLEQGHFGLVREALLERDEWQQLAPDATRVERFFFPIYGDSPRGRLVLYSGATLYQWLAGRFSVGKSCLHSVAEVTKAFPGLRSTGLRGAVSYCDVVMNDEDLAQTLVEEAKHRGVSLHEHTPISRIDTTGFLDINGTLQKFDRVINAAGPWASSLLERSGISSAFELEHVRGSHLILRVDLKHALVFQTAADQRIVFAIPIGQGRTLFGTTEHAHDLAEPIVCSEQEIDYLLAIYNQYMTHQIDRSDIESSYSGVRPIARRRSESFSNISTASRDSEIEIIDQLINVFGGKWTSARRLGSKVASLTD